MSLPPWRLIRDLRQASGLTQRELARRAGTSQPAVARYESGRVVPDLATLERLLHAMGHRLVLDARPLDDVERRQLAESIRMTPTARVEWNRRVTALAAEAVRARRDGRVRPLVPRAPSDA